ncbi:MAG: hypothetical protein ABSE86_13485 [Bryobacteraceae bacterium]|jgi:uncharacterized protein (TIGR03437 family)
MGAARKFDLDRRLEGHFATLRSLKHSAGNWQMYAAVTGSAMAMATNASAQIIGSGIRDIGVDPIASVRVVQGYLANSKFAVVGMPGSQAEAPSPLSAQLSVPLIAAGGVVPLDGTVSIIAPGELVSIFGSNLASETASWNGNFPTTLGGTSVEIDGKAAFLMYVSPGQINLQAPDSTSLGSVSVVVKTQGGTAKSTVTLGEFAPAFNLLDGKFAAGIILRTNGSGAYGGGTYDILGPTGTKLGYRTVAARPGDIVELFAVGLGPTTPVVPAGKPFTGSAPVIDPISLYINNVSVTPTFVGLSSAGLYQINLNVPSGLGQGAVPIVAVAGGLQTQMQVRFSLEICASGNLVTGGCSSGTGVIRTGGGFGGGSGFGSGFGSGGGTGGGGGGTGGGGGGTGGGGGGGTGGGGGGGGAGGGGGSGGGTGGGGGSGGGSVAAPVGGRAYQPRLRFPPK